MVEAGESSNTDSSSIPRGVYHYSDTDRQIESSFKVPDFEALDPIKMASDLMSSAMKMDTKRKTLAGLELPFSFTGRPMSIQINGESHNAVSLIDEESRNNREINTKKTVRRSDMSPESRKAFLRARHVCIEQSADSCDEALDTFHRIRFGSSLLAKAEGNNENDEDEHYSTIIRERLRKMEDGVPTTTRNPSLYYSSASRPSEVHATYALTKESDSLPDDEPEPDNESGSPYHSFNHHRHNNFHEKAKNFLRFIN